MKVDAFFVNRVGGVSVIKEYKICEVCNSSKGVRDYKKQGHYLCGKHAYQMKKYGKILNRTKYDPNEILICDDYALLCLYDKNCNEIARTIIDLNDVDKVSKHKWYLHSNGYVCNRSKGNVLYLHRYLMGVEGESFIDHINMNKLDNRKNNLRMCTNAENMRNKKEMSNNYSGFRGVDWNKEVKKWEASLTFNKEYIHLGWFDLFNDACQARINGEKLYYKDFAPK